VLHAAWSVIVLAVAGLLIGLELGAPCPPGGPLSFGQCALRPIVPPVVGVGALLYVGGLSAMVVWIRRLRRRRLGDPSAAREWYLLAVVLGAPTSLLLAFTLVSALR
jgi:uncharacterized iron-regulated membrane protein